MNKRALILTSIGVAGLVATAIAAQQARPRIPPTGAIEHVRDNLYKIPGAGGNTTVFVRTDGVVLVDTKLANNGQAILDQVKTVTDKPVTMVINTHVHPDHNGSNDFFKAARPTIDIVAHANTKALAEKNPRSNPAMIPTKTFTDKMSLGSGKDRIDLYYFGAAHTNGDAFIVFPSVRAMDIGDIMAWKMGPLIDPASGGSELELPKTIEKAEKAIKGVDLVIEGHGDVNTWQGMVAYRRFMAALNAEAAKALKAGKTPEDALAELQKNPEWKVFLGEELLKDLEYGGTPKSRALIDLNVAFQELKGEPVTTAFGPRPPGPPPGAAPPAGAAPATPPPPR